MTNKQAKVMEATANYLRYAANVEVHQKPTRHINSGAHGNAFERAIKLSLGNYEFKGVSPARQADTRKRINNLIETFEIKQGAGELGTIDKDGTQHINFNKRSFAIVAVEYDPAYDDAVGVAYILSAAQCWQIWEDLGLLREKTSSAQCRQLPKEQRYHDRITLQTYTTSKKKTNAYYDALEQYATPLADWLDEQGINFGFEWNGTEWKEI